MPVDYAIYWRPSCMPQYCPTFRLPACLDSCPQHPARLHWALGRRGGNRKAMRMILCRRRPPVQPWLQTSLSCLSRNMVIVVGWLLLHWEEVSRQPSIWRKKYSLMGCPGLLATWGLSVGVILLGKSVTDSKRITLRTSSDILSKVFNSRLIMMFSRVPGSSCTPRNSKGSKGNRISSLILLVYTSYQHY